MGSFKDLTGQKIGKLTVIKKDEEKSNEKRTYWLCECECGKTCSKRIDSLKGNCSCGCIARETYKENFKNKPTHISKYGKSENGIIESRTKFYRTFDHMKSRCYNKNNIHYSSYGARGIKIEWNNYQEFKNDMYESYLEHCKLYGEENTSIDRIDNNKNYSKENCKWSTRKEQVNNMQQTVFVEKDGDLIPITTVAEELGVTASSLRKRYYRSKYNGTKRIPYDFLIRKR